MCACRGEGNKDTGQDSSSQALPAAKESNKTSPPSCCNSSAPSSSSLEAEKAPSMFEFFKQNSGGNKNKKESSNMAMVGHCESIEGGLNACVWVPQADADADDALHTIIF